MIPTDSLLKTPIVTWLSIYQGKMKMHAFRAMIILIVKVSSVLYFLAEICGLSKNHITRVYAVHGPHY